IGHQLLQRLVRTNRPLEVGGQRLVQQQQIDLLNTQFPSRLIKAVQRLVVAVVGDPQLGLDEDLGAVQARLLDALADLALVAIGGCGIDQTVANAQGLSDCGDGLLRRGLEDAEAQRGHGDTIVQGDVPIHDLHARSPAAAEEGTVSTPLTQPVQLSRRGHRPAAASGVAVRLPSSLIRSWLAEPGSAVKANMNQSGFAGNSIAWSDSSRSPTAGWCTRF